jgi:hypothetical protein
VIRVCCAQRTDSVEVCAEANAQAEAQHQAHRHSHHGNKGGPASPASFGFGIRKGIVTDIVYCHYASPIVAPQLERSTRRDNDEGEEFSGPLFCNLGKNEGRWFAALKFFSGAPLGNVELTRRQCNVSQRQRAWL